MSDKITAFELRAAGIPVPDDIPDVAWTLRSGIRYEFVPEEPVSEEAKEAREFNIAVRCTFQVPFQWVHIEGTVTA